MTTETNLRNSDLAEIAARLQADHARKNDLVVPASKLRSEDRLFLVTDARTTIDLDGVTVSDLPLDLGQTILGQTATRLGVPVKYFRDLYSTGEKSPRISGLFDETVNAHLAEDPNRSFLLRTFDDPDGGPGFGRAILSDRYSIIDNLDVLVSALEGLKSTGIDAKVVGCDLSESKMRVRVTAPEIAALAPDLLRGYRSPYGGARGEENPTVFAGFEIANSEVGDGSFTIVPRLEVEICSNGMRMTKDAFRKIHLGARLDEGAIRWSGETQRKNLELVKSQTADAVSTFLDVEYVRKSILVLEESAGTKLSNPTETVEKVAKKLAWSDSERDGIFAAFIEGGTVTAGGVLHAATAFAQKVTDPDRAAEIEESAVPAMEYAASIA